MSLDKKPENTQLEIKPALGDSDIHRTDGTDPVPTLNAGLLLRMPIIRDRARLHSNPFAHTPLGPDDLFENAMPYRQAAMQVLEAQLSSAAQSAGIDHGDQPYDDILSELFVEQDRRLIGNTVSRDRLLELIGGTTLSIDEATLLWRARLGIATPIETAMILLRYPVMGSIEAVKYVSPFDKDIAVAVDTYLDESMKALQTHDETGVALTVYNPDDKVSRDVRFVDTEATLVAKNIVCVKQNYAKVSNGLTTVQLVRKHSGILLPANSGLRVTFNPIRIGDTIYNNQPIAESCYWRIKPAAAPEDTL